MQKSSSLLYSNFILNLYIVYELNRWSRNATNNFPLKNWWFGLVKVVRNTVKITFIYNAWGKAFHGEGLWSFGNDFARNVVICSAGNSSLSHNYHWKNGDGIIDSTGTAEKRWELTLIKQRQNFA